MIGPVFRQCWLPSDFVDECPSKSQVYKEITAPVVILHPLLQEDQNASPGEQPGSLILPASPVLTYYISSQRQLDANQLLEAIRDDPTIIQQLLDQHSKDKKIADLEKSLARQKQKNHDLSVALNQNKEENLQHQQHGRDILYRLLRQHQLDETCARSVQKKASDKALDLFEQGKKRVIIILPTGAGKVGVFKKLW